MVGPLDRGIYLASRSPRRRELLAQIGVRYHLLLFREPARVARPTSTRTPLPGEAPDAYVERVARAKAEAGWRAAAAAQSAARAGARRRHHGGARRPHPRQARRPQAKPPRCWRRCPGASHEVLTAVALKRDERDRARRVALARCEFKRARGRGDRAVRRHRRADDKAGAYAIQGRAARFVMRAARQLLRRHGPAAVRNRPAAREGYLRVTEEILINVTPQETRVAVIRQGVVQELHIERSVEPRAGRQHLHGPGGARAARHAVGLHRDRPGARRLPARRRHLGAPRSDNGDAAQADRAACCRRPDADGAGGEGPDRHQGRAAVDADLASPAACWSTCRRIRTSASRSASRTRPSAQALREQLQRAAAAGRKRRLHHPHAWPKTATDDELRADIDYLRKPVARHPRAPRRSPPPPRCCTRTCRSRSACCATS